MTDADLAQAKETIRRCRGHRLGGRVEAVLRSELDSRLRLIFPSTRDEAWINHYTAGAEARTRVGIGRATANRFIDNLIGATTIEYEADLRTSTRHEHGLLQVKEHAAGLIRAGVPSHQVRGVLSDTVQWYAYDAELAEDVDPADCVTDDVTLCRIDQIELTAADDLAAERLIAFLRRHLGREQSQPLRAEYLALDLGLESGTHLGSNAGVVAIVREGRAAHRSIRLATDLWSEFVDQLQGGTGTFRTEIYADEVYLIVLARLLSANVLAGRALRSTDEELAAILNGSHFRDKYQLDNMVEHDYFGGSPGPNSSTRSLPWVRRCNGICLRTISAPPGRKTCSVGSWLNLRVAASECSLDRSVRRYGCHGCWRSGASRRCRPESHPVPSTCVVAPGRSWPK